MSQLQQTQPARIDPAKMYQALSSFAGRVAATDDPKEHKKAGEALKSELKGCKIKP